MLDSHAEFTGAFSNAPRKFLNPSADPVFSKTSFCHFSCALTKEQGGEKCHCSCAKNRRLVQVLFSFSLPYPSPIDELPRIFYSSTSDFCHRYRQGDLLRKYIYIPLPTPCQVIHRAISESMHSFTALVTTRHLVSHSIYRCNFSIGKQQ